MELDTSPQTAPGSAWKDTPAAIESACRISGVGENLVMVPLHIQLETLTLRKVLKRLHYPLEVMLVCVRWYAAYPLSLRNLEEMMAERGVIVDHATVHRWALKVLPVLAVVFRRRKRPVGSRWRMDETYIRIGGQWKYLYRAVDRLGHTVDFLRTAKRDLAAARRFFERAIDLNGRSREDHDRQERGQHRGGERDRRQRRGHRVAPVQVLEQPRRAGPPGRQAPDPPDVRIQGLPFGRQDHPPASRPCTWKGQLACPDGQPMSAAEQFYSLAL